MKKKFLTYILPLASIALLIVPSLAHSAVLEKRTDKLWRNGTVQYELHDLGIWGDRLTTPKNNYPYPTNPGETGVKQLDALNNAFARITEAHPGITFEQVPQGTANHERDEDHQNGSVVLIIRNSDGGAPADIGLPFTRSPKLEIGSGLNETIMVHELLHSIGFYHQQSCVTRDDYLCYYTENYNLSDGQYSQYRLADSRALGRYDFDSVMQYTDDRFIKTNPSEPQIILGKKKIIGEEDCDISDIFYDPSKPKGSGKSFTAQRQYMSQIDKWALRNAYFHSTKSEPGADFNGDGFADMVIGVPSNTQEIDDNLVHVIYGNGYSVNQSVSNGSYTRTVVPALGQVNDALDTTYSIIDESNSIYSTQKILDQDVNGAVNVKESEDKFGSVIAAGDFNGDFQQDLAIGIPGEDGIGAVQVIYSYQRLHTSFEGPERGPFVKQGGQTPASDHNIRDCIYLGSELGSKFGSTIISTDFNGDGYSDLAVAAPNETVNGKANAGVIRIWLGSRLGLNGANSTNAINEVQLIDQSSDSSATGSYVQANDRFGSSMTIGDFNGDGRGDLAIGAAHDHINGKDDAGLVVIYYGRNSSNTPLGNPTPNINQTQSFNNQLVDDNDDYDRWGEVLESGDFDGDGYTDLVVGAPGENDESSSSHKIDHGAITVFYGDSFGITPNPPSGKQNRAIRILQSAVEPGDKFGAALHGADLNGDGVSDLAVGSPGEDYGSDNSLGRVDIYYGKLANGNTPGGLSGNVNSHWDKIHGNDVRDLSSDLDDSSEFGAAISGGDFDNNGYVDLIIGAPGVTLNGKSDAGQIIVLLNSHEDLAIDPYTIDRRDTEYTAGGTTSPQAGDRFGSILMK